MNFGEKIYELRSKNGMSQGELADELDVSRQAVSKWENNSAVPDLDRIIKMSELFGISIDELVKGTALPEIKANDEEIPEQAQASVIVKTSIPLRKIVGLFLFGMAFITALVFFFLVGPAGMIYSIPFVIFGAICFCCEKYVGLKCLWAAYFMIMMFIGLTMGISVFDIRRTFSWTYEMNYARLALAWVLVAYNAFMVFFTAKKLKNEPIKDPEKAKKHLILVWAAVAGVFVVVYAFDLIISNIISNILSIEEYHFALSNIFGVFMVFEEYVYAIAFTFALSYTLLYRKHNK